MSQKEMLENQVLEEILRERATFYLSKNKELDFWITIDPLFVKNKKFADIIRNSRFYKQQEKLIKSDTGHTFYSSLITTDKEFITWLKLRLGDFENINEINSELSKDAISDGIYGIIDLLNEKVSPLSFNKNYLNLEIITKKYKKALDIYYSNL
jgi:hypothetical protein